MMQQIADQFIGRSKETDIFTHWLMDSKAPWILYVYDAAEEEDKKGGVGKTWLLRRWSTLVQQERPEIAVAMIDFFNLADRDRIAIAEHVVDALKSAYPSWSPTTFARALEQYRVEEYRNVITPESFDVANVQIRDRLATALAADLHTLDNMLGAAKKSLVVFFDTFELVERDPLIAVLNLSHKFPDSYKFKHIGVVIAGRNRLNWAHPNWQGREKEVQCLPVAPFSPQEMLSYINTEYLYEQKPQNEQAAALYDRTEGRPILVGLVTDVLNQHIVTLDEIITVPRAEFESRLVTQINKLDNPLNWTILFMAHVYHRFNVPILDWILRESELGDVLQDAQGQSVLEILPTLSFVRRASSGDDFVLHDEMRRLVTKYCWDVQDPGQRNRKDISRCMIRYYEQKIANGVSEQERQLYIVEILYHTFFLSIEDGMDYFHLHFHNAVNLWKSPFARLLLQEALLFEQSMSHAQRNDLKLAETKLVRAEENAAGALELHQELEREAGTQWLEEHLAEQLFEKGRCYVQLSNFNEAIMCFNRCLEIEKARGKEARYASLLGSIAYIYRRRGQLDLALRSYKECAELYRRLGNLRSYANILNSIGNIYRFQGKLEEALRRSKIAWRLRNDLFHVGKASEVDVALSLSTMGMIYLEADDIIQADSFFQKAFETYYHAGYKKGIAATYNRLGQVQVVKGDLLQAKRLFEKAEEAAAEVDSEAYINSLNKQGRMFARNQQWEEAAIFLKKAVGSAQEFHDSYQLAESLIELTEALEHLDQHSAAQKAWRDAREIVEREDYAYLRGRSEEILADVAYSKQDYRLAFTHYSAYCHYMALYNSVAYGKALRKVVDRLLGVPIDQISPIVDLLVSYWGEHSLNEKYRELIDACEEVKSLMVL